MTPLFTKIAAIITEFGDAIVLVAFVGIFYWSLNKKLGKKLVINLSLLNIVNPCLKSIIKRPRPYMDKKDVKCLKIVNDEGDMYDPISQGYSFPSGHAVNSISVYGGIQ